MQAGMEVDVQNKKLKKNKQIKKKKNINNTLNNNKRALILLQSRNKFWVKRI